ncbi:YnfC family lipoprotein [Providencia huaxiensis]|uniref:YnfC family lipoprotein n=1 Tax=Providencia huaxiensis TaxID=2027290 RepID=UPI001EFDF2CF|nr:YnfC family lipoprotein [Providencia huaxiensis]MCG9534231.1 YnfC family lipoprotein [Providencia huaxiensis]
MIRTFFTIMCLSVVSIPVEALSHEKQSYQPNVFNLAQMYDFNPVKGNVKELKSTMYNDDGTIFYESILEMDSNGCVDSFTLKKNKDRYLSSSDIFLSLTLSNGKLLGKDNSGPVEIQFDENCLVTSLRDSSGVINNIHNENGYLKNRTNGETGDTLSEYFYNKNGLINNVKYYVSGMVFSESIVNYLDETSKPFDFYMENKSSNKTSAIVNSECSYDENGNPSDCDINITISPDNNPIKIHKKATTEVRYY